MEKEWIECKRCGDTVEVPKGKRRCYECDVETAPKNTPTNAEAADLLGMYDSDLNNL